MAFVIRISTTPCITASQRKASRQPTPGFRVNPDGYYQWAKTHNSLLIVTFDENDAKDKYHRFPIPLVSPSPTYPPANEYDQRPHDLRNRIVTIFPGAHIKSGVWAEGKGITHINMRAIEAMHGLPSRETQQPNPAGAGIADGTIVTGVFEPLPQPAGNADHHSLPAAPSSDVNMTLPLWLMG